MKNQKTSTQKGFVLWHGILVVLVIAVISFIGGTVFTNQRQMQEAKNNEAKAKEVTDAAALKESQKSKPEPAAETVAIPAEQKKVEPVVTPAPKPAPAPAPKKVTSTTPAKKEPSYVGITGSAQVGAETVVLTASLPAVYSGTCKALVKQMDTSNARWLEATFTSASTCSITVPRSTLTTASEWQYYLYFNSSDWSVKGDSGKNTFTL